MDDALRVRFEEGMEEGMELGLEKGQEQAAENIAVNFLRNGVDPELTAKGTGLPLEKVLHLSERMAKN
jgi:flagellar biosynthesis/type III secretory pathway protein FliH